jgi:DNA-binding NarL/FixJ family response regulator
MAADEIYEVIVRGGGGLMAGVVARVLESAGMVVLADNGSGRAGVAVLIEPTALDWSALGGPVPAVVLVDAPPDGDRLADLVAAGAQAVLPSNCEQPQLIDTVRRVCDGDTSLTRSQTRLLVEAVQARARRNEPAAVALTPRERDVLGAIERGVSIKQAARELGISPRTVENTQRVLFRKLGVRNRAQAVLRCQALGLLDAHHAESAAPPL